MACTSLYWFILVYTGLYWFIHAKIHTDLKKIILTGETDVAFVGISKFVILEEHNLFCEQTYSTVY